MDLTWSHCIVQILPKTQAGASYDAEDGESSDDWMDKGQLPNESNKRTRQVSLN